MRNPDRREARRNLISMLIQQLAETSESTLNADFRRAEID
jgi:hypothetical protein